MGRTTKKNVGLESSDDEAPVHHTQAGPPMKKFKKAGHSRAAKQAMQAAGFSSGSTRSDLFVDCRSLPKMSEEKIAAVFAFLLACDDFQEDVFSAICFWLHKYGKNVSALIDVSTLEDDYPLINSAYLILLYCYGIDARSEAKPITSDKTVIEYQQMVQIGVPEYCTPDFLVVRATKSQIWQVVNDKLLMRCYCGNAPGVVEGKSWRGGPPSPTSFVCGKGVCRLRITQPALAPIKAYMDELQVAAGRGIPELICPHHPEADVGFIFSSGGTSKGGTQEELPPTLTVKCHGWAEQGDKKKWCDIGYNLYTTEISPLDEAFVGLLNLLV